MSRFPGALLMMATLAAGCGPGGSANPPQLWLARGVDELHAQLVNAPPAPY
ncbi:MAG TPA: hypothetical protein VF945_18915 [Polyangia bacterium]